MVWKLASRYDIHRKLPDDRERGHRRFGEVMNRIQSKRYYHLSKKWSPEARYGQYLNDKYVVCVCK
jgi:hypothetical protein